MKLKNLKIDDERLDDVRLGIQTTCYALRNAWYCFYVKTQANDRPTVVRLSTAREFHARGFCSKSSLSFSHLNNPSSHK